MKSYTPLARVTLSFILGLLFLPTQPASLFQVIGFTHYKYTILTIFHFLAKRKADYCFGVITLMVLSSSVGIDYFPYKENSAPISLYQSNRR
jgi:general stress protein CsbA